MGHLESMHINGISVNNYMTTAERVAVLKQIHAEQQRLYAVENNALLVKG